MDQETIRKLFEYRDGALYWRKKKPPKVSAGDRAGCYDNNGYRVVGINRVRYYEHRLIFLYHHGRMPELMDHIDRNPSNNTIENLREVPHSVNMHNRAAWTNTGHKGVHRRRNGKYVAYIWRGKNTQLGTFTALADAIHAYVAAERAMYGEDSISL